MFTENSVIGRRLLKGFEAKLEDMSHEYKITYIRSITDIAKTLLKEVVGFVPEEKKRKDQMDLAN